MALRVSHAFGKVTSVFSRTLVVGVFISSLLDSFESVFGHGSDCSSAAIFVSGSKAESSTVCGSFRTGAPADGSDSFPASFAWLVAKTSSVFQTGGALHGLTSGTTVRSFSARDADVFHSTRAVGRANATSSVMEAFSAFRVP